MMPEVSTFEAARIIGMSDDTVRRHVRIGSLPARRQGPRRDARIDIEKLREFATKYNYRFDEALAAELASE